jgi:hypothetical protein
MGLRSRLFAFTYDRFSKGSEKAGLAEMRKNLIAGASGDVLEIGGGTGANLGYYGAGVESLTVTEPEPLRTYPAAASRSEAGSRASLSSPRDACGVQKLGPSADSMFRSSGEGARIARVGDHLIASAIGAYR